MEPSSYPFCAMQLSRRRFLTYASLSTGSLLTPQLLASPSRAQAPAILTADNMRPTIPYGVATGDISGGSAILWSRSDRPARMIVEYSLDETFKNARRILGPAALDHTDFTARLNLTGLPRGQQIFYRVFFEDLAYPGTLSLPTTGRFRTPPTNQQEIRFAWSGDTAGQGWGINPGWGGFKIYETLRQQQPQFLIHCGDYIYADNELKSEVTLDDGSIWRNLVTPAKAKVAETLAEFRGNYAYNLLDENVRRFNAEVPQMVQWDDHETVNNWYPTEMLMDDTRYTVKSVSLLAARAKQAFLDYTPTRLSAEDPERIYRAFQYGPLLDIFMLDQRSYRSPNTANRQSQLGPDTVFMGNAQLQWLKQRLQQSQATWKVIASDMPIGLIVRDGPNAFENATNGDGPALGRELEFAELFRWIKQRNLRNIVWLTADVHYAAAHYYDPNKAQFQDFLPFWEFVAGPLNSGTFGPNALDNTFGPQVVFQSVPAGMKPNRSPQEGLQFFGMVRVTAEALTIQLLNQAGNVLHEQQVKAA